MYEKHVWGPKEEIASALLNNIENGVENSLTTESELGLQKVVNTEKESLTGMTSGWALFAGATIAYSKGSVIATLSSTNANSGMLAPIFKSNSNFLKVSIEAEVTGIDSATVQLGYQNSANSWKYDRKGTVAAESGGKINYSFEFDAPWYAVYNDAKAFRILVNNGTGTANAGTIKITVLTIVEQDVEQLSIYDPSLTNILGNIDARLPKKSDDQQISFPFISHVGKKFKMNVNDIGELSAVPTIPNNVLFMGNSLLLGISQGDHGVSNFGMCASSSKADYYHHVTEAIKEKNSAVAFNKLHVGTLETGTKQSDYDAYMTANANQFSADLDLIILQIGDNINTEERRNYFKTIYPKLLRDLIFKCPNARIVTVGAFFGSVMQPILNELSNEYGAELVPLVDLNVTVNQGSKGMTITYDDDTTIIANDSWITHPGDKGHKLIAERIIKQLNM
ncbi:hypothetical protein [Enterococcus sp. AZ126]|uniref:hypothetical protein n=1 Tax=Enterococcus sp. AZ126 TaxID=2774635 RepID=UPI003F25389D